MITFLDPDVAEILAGDSGSRIGLMLYGSVARGTADGGSDIDVLELVTGPARSYRRGNASVTQYEVTHLRSLAAQGSLFVLHLRSEGLVLQDPKEGLRRALDAYVHPDNYDHIWDQLEIASAILDPQAKDADLYTASLVRLGIYLLRTAVYLRSIEAGNLTFDLGAIDWVLKNPGLRRALEMRRKQVFTQADLQLLHEQLQLVLPTVAKNPYPTIEAYAVSQSTQPDLAALFTTVLQHEDGIDYSGLTLPPF